MPPPAAARPHTTATPVGPWPNCQIEESHGKAYADAKLSFGPWAYVCQPCFQHYGCKLGLGLGQRLIEKETTTKEGNNK